MQSPTRLSANAMNSLMRQAQADPASPLGQAMAKKMADAVAEREHKAVPQ